MSATFTGNPPSGQVAPHRHDPGGRDASRALAALMVVQHASAARNVAATDESLSLDARQIYQSLADADVTVSTAYLYGRTGPNADRVRYRARTLT
jgi:hypothetical protein